MTGAAAAAVFRIEAADRLRLELHRDGVWRLAWRTPDWLGPLGLRVEHAGRVHSGPDGDLRASVRSFEGEDDLGPHRGLRLEWQGLPFPLHTSVRAYPERPVLVFRLESPAHQRGLATGSYARPSVAWPWCRPARRLAGGVPEDTCGFAHQFTEFAFPTTTTSCCSRTGRRWWRRSG